jgi:transposase
VDKNGKAGPAERRERAVRMALEIETGNGVGMLTRVARQLGVGTESLRNWVRPGRGRRWRPGISTEDSG